MRINGVDLKAYGNTPVINGGKQARVNANYPYEYDKWRMVWNGNHFAPPDSGSVLYLPGIPGAGSTIQDFSGSGNNGTITGATWTKLSSGLWYLSFDSNDLVNCGTSDTLNLAAGAHTVLAWVQTTSKGTEKEIFWRMNPNSPYQGFALTKSNAEKVQVWAGNDPPGWLSGNSTTVSNGAWHLVGYTKNGATTTILLDGAADGTPTGGAGQSYAGATAYIGVKNGTTQFWVGGIALLRVLNATVTTAQFASIFQHERHLFGV